MCKNKKCNESQEININQTGTSQLLHKDFLLKFYVKLLEMHLQICCIESKIHGNILKSRRIQIENLSGEIRYF